MMDNASELLELARQKFEKITKAEEKLFRAVANGEIADYSAKEEKANDPAKAAKWGSSRVLLADRIAWLCTDKRASKLVTHRGIQIRGARIDENFDLLFANVPFPLFFKLCKFTADINLQYSQIAALNMPGTHTGPISADGLNANGPVYLRNGFKAEGEVRLLNATVGGDLECSNGQFINKEGNTLSADRAKIGGGIFLCNGFKAEGEVRLLGATVGGNLNCSNGQFINKDGKALFADGSKIDGDVFLREGFKAEGEVRLPGASIGGDLDCSKGQFINKEVITLIVNRAKIGGGIFLCNGFKAEGEVRLVGAKVGGYLKCDNGQFINKDGEALIADGLNVEGSVCLFNGFVAEGGIRLFGATIGGSLDCGNGKFINKSKEAFVADGLVVRGSVFMNKGFKSKGQVRLFGATIGVNLDCIEGQFINGSESALNADELKVSGGVYLNNDFRAEGLVSFVGATIDGHFSLRHIQSSGQMTLNLNSAIIGTLHDKENSWPGHGRLVLHGLQYKNISYESPRDSKSRIEWLRLQDGFWTQPYEQLAKVLRESGDDSGAKDVLIAKNKDKAERAKKLTRSQWLWYHLLGPLIGYGYRPWMALPWALGMILLGWIFFAIGYSQGLITPPSDSAYTTEENLPVPDPGNADRGISKVYPVFNSLVYSIDVFVPVVDMRQAKYWLPNANRGDKLIKIGSWPLHTGGVLLFWLWCDTVFGWILTTLFLVGLTGLVRT